MTNELKADIEDFLNELFIANFILSQSKKKDVSLLLKTMVICNKFKLVFPDPISFNTFDDETRDYLNEKLSVATSFMESIQKHL
jgi:hypothetical protein